MRSSAKLVTSTVVFGTEILKTPLRADMETSIVRFLQDRAAAVATKAAVRTVEIKLTISAGSRRGRWYFRSGDYVVKEEM